MSGPLGTGKLGWTEPWGSMTGEGTWACGQTCCLQAYPPKPGLNVVHLRLPPRTLERKILEILMTCSQ